MKLLYVVFAFMLLESALMVTHEIRGSACNCDHCQDSKILSARANETAGHSESTFLDKEDNDGDGSLVICARDRNQEDRTFLSVCQMHCYNRCTKFRVVRKNNTRKYVVSAHRTNYYKLKDGPC